MSTAAVNYSSFGSTIVYENRNGTERAYMCDPLGSTVGLLDSDQNITDTLAYWPFGEVQSRTGTTATPLTFVGTLGYLLDAATQFSYVRGRHYVATLARWLTVDPMWPKQRSYGYAELQPVDKSDPTGHATRIPCSVTVCSMYALKFLGIHVFNHQWICAQRANGATCESGAYPEGVKLNDGLSCVSDSSQYINCVTWYTDCASAQFACACMTHWAKKYNYYTGGACLGWADQILNCVEAKWEHIEEYWKVWEDINLPCIIA